MWLVPSSGASLTTREKGRKSGGGRETERQRGGHQLAIIHVPKTIKKLRKEIRDVGGRKGGREGGREGETSVYHSSHFQEECI